MNKFQKRVITALATGSMLLQSALPIFASMTLTITGNGADTVNTVGVGSTQSTTVTQSNSTSVHNDIDVDANTGDNEAEDNTGGDVTIDTGNSKVNVTIANDLNSNVAEVEPCNCDSDTTVEITGNVEGSENTAGLKQSDAAVVTQYNVANVKNEVDVDSETGDNDANDNAGGDVTIDTGKSTVTIMAGTVANTNVARIQPAQGGSGGSVSLLIAQNGQDTKNKIGLELGRLAWINQTNLTSIDNDFDVDAETGDNDAKDNVGGTVEIDTGNVILTAEVSNLAGFNSADLGCDCMLEDVTAKIGQNVEDSENTIEALLVADSGASQFNYCGFMPNIGFELLGGPGPIRRDIPCFDNHLDLDGETGDNDANDNAGGVEGGDPTIDTGNVETTVKVDNAGGSNVFGDFELEMPDWDWPGSGVGLDFSFSFDLSDFLSWLDAQA